MSTRSLYRIFLISGLIVLAAILGGFLGLYVLLRAVDAFGGWFYLAAGVAFACVIVVLYIYDTYKKKKSGIISEASACSGVPDSEMETDERDDHSD